GVFVLIAVLVLIGLLPALVLSRLSIGWLVRLTVGALIAGPLAVDLLTVDLLLLGRFILRLFVCGPLIGCGLFFSRLGFGGLLCIYGLAPSGLNGLDQIALAHACGAFDTQLGRDLLRFWKHFAAEPTAGPTTGFFGFRRRGCLLISCARNGFCHVNSSLERV